MHLDLNVISNRSINKKQRASFGGGEAEGAGGGQRRHYMTTAY